MRSSTALGQMDHLRPLAFVIKLYRADPGQDRSALALLCAPGANWSRASWKHVQRRPNVSDGEGKKA